MARDVSQRRAESSSGVAALLLNQVLSGLDEQRKDIVVDVLQVVADVHSASLDDILWLRNTNALELDASLRLNLLHKHLRLVRVERDAGAASASSCRATTPVDVGLSLFGRLELDDEVDIWDVKTTRGDICGHEHSEFALFEALHCDFTLVLGNVTMHDLNVLLDLVRQQEGVGIGLGLREDDDLTTLAVDYQNVSKS